MKPDKTIEFVKRWQQIQRKTKELDWEKTQFARDLRAQFDTDKQLIHWCSIELGLAEGIARELLVRAVASQVVRDEATWKSVGGFTSVRQVAELPKKQQIHVIQSAASQNKSVRSVMREQGLIPEPVYRKTDAEILASFVAGLPGTVKIPPEVRVVLNKYIVAQSRAAA